MHWPPTQTDKTAWSAVGGVVTLAMSGAAVVSPLWPIFTVLAVAGFYMCLAPLLYLWPWSRVATASPQTAIKAGHGIKAGGDIEADGGIEAGRGIEAGSRIRSSAHPRGLLFASAAARTIDPPGLRFPNPLFGHYRIGQYARPLEHDEHGCVFRTVVAPDCPSAVDELDTAIKDALADALSRSSLESWGRRQSAKRHGGASTDWLRSYPNSGQTATFKRDWGVSSHSGSTLSAKATFELPSGPQFGPRPVLVLDVIEQAAGTDLGSPRLCLSVSDLHQFLHILANTVVDELGGTVFPVVCKQAAPPILGPNYEISFGDRSLNTTVEIPHSFERTQDAYNNQFAEINTPEDCDPRDQAVRDAVIRSGLQKVFRSNGYDRIEAEIAKLPDPLETPPRAL